MRILITLPLVLTVFIAGCTSYTPTPTPTPVPTTTNTIEITSDGFNPSSLTIKVGDTVTFVNKETTQHWPASDIHPIHNIYPEGGGCIGSKFDACKGLKQGDSFSFTFSRSGRWCYHDHLNPVLTGCVDVQ